LPITDDMFTPRYNIHLNWANGTIASVDYTTSPGLFTNAASRTIETTLSYENGTTGAIIALDKTDGKAGGATSPPPIVPFSYEGGSKGVGNRFVIQKLAERRQSRSKRVEWAGSFSSRLARSTAWAAALK
jgi:hypothetical protein